MPCFIRKALGVNIIYIVASKVYVFLTEISVFNIIFHMYYKLSGGP